MPTMTFEECPNDLDVLIVGIVPPEIVEEQEVLDFFKRTVPTTKHVIAICYGMLVLAASGLLKGKQATNNSNVGPMLGELGVIAVAGSDVVIDGHIFTSGPATGSFDASLMVLEQLRGTQFAQLVELAIEYDPRPPFNTGSALLAGASLTKIAQGMTAELNQKYYQSALTAYKRNN